ncbi:Domain of uncharacterised function (DUF2825) [Salmonella enterica]|uniref:Domain of uncharacterized function (DUF2825) n=1 Tax=Salmonella enterica TaxID=28901 RepID=A0A7D8IU94_SALER|nr:Domain of uncharacterised function (DUF2825) [Salmonella enterica]
MLPRSAGVAAVYPRWRGEHRPVRTLTHNQNGLSPLARGTRKSRPGFTDDVTVYPRWRGEHPFVHTPIMVALGLSPLARGTPRFSISRISARRFIPAGAGNTSLKTKELRSTPVYPRWRGEHGTFRGQRKCITGLSPLARGTQTGARTCTEDMRFIPAGAGNTLSQPMRQMRLTVYPRWRGEHSTRARIRRFVSGLSPLARGTLCGILQYRRGMRFIPAGAGNTLGEIDLKHPNIGLSPLARGTPGNAGLGS